MPAIAHDAATEGRGLSTAYILIVAVLLGLLAGWVDLHNDEVQAAVLVIVCSAGILGLASPRLAIVSGVLVGLGVPIVHAIARQTHVPIPFPMHSYWETFIALIPGVIGAGVGALVRRAISSL